MMQSRNALLISASLAAVMAIHGRPAIAQSLPSEGQVVSGQAAIGRSDGASLTINQGSERAVIDWSSFNIAAGSQVLFVQPDAGSAVLNRVTGDAGSEIAGALVANGSVFLINPNGIQISESGTINVGRGFVATTLDLSNADFMEGSGELRGAGAGLIVHAGSISTGDGGYVALLGGSLLARGQIIAPSGKVTVGATSLATFDIAGDGFLQLVIPDAEASGAAYLALPSHEAQTLARNIVNIPESIDARTVSGTSGNIVLGGSIQAEGGSVDVLTGGDISLASARIDVSSDHGPGGSVRIGGDYQGSGPGIEAASVSVDSGSSIAANGWTDGGSIIVWSLGHTVFDGTLEARGGISGGGGFAEISGRSFEIGAGPDDIDLGVGGKLLLDPLDVIIDAALASTITAQLNAGTDVAVSTLGVGGDQGNITVAAQIQVTNTANQASLTLTADNDILVNQRITSLQPVSGGNIFEFTAGGNIQVNSLVQSALLSNSNIGLTAGGSVTVAGSGSIDGGGSSVTVQALAGNIDLQSGAQILAGINTSTDNSVSLVAGDTVRFSGGLVQTFGATDTLIRAQRFVNTTGVNAISSIGGAGFWNIALPHPFGKTATSDPHAYGGLLSNNPATYNSAGNANPSRNEYHYAFQPTVDIASANLAKDYGDAATVSASVDPAGLVSAAAYGNVFTQDTVGSILSGTLTASSSGTSATAPVGTYAVTASGLTPTTGYAANYVAGSLTVSPRAITLTAGDQDKTYGDLLMLDTTAFVVLDKDGDAVLPNGESIDSVTLTSLGGVDVSTTANIGIYVDEIVISGQAGSGGFAASNYAITYGAGDLTVTPRALTVTADDVSRVYGDANPATGTASGDNLVNGDTITSVSLASAADTASDVGSYDLLASNAAGTGLSNYAITYAVNTGGLSVTPRALTVTADDQSRVVGTPNPALTYRITGGNLVSGDRLSGSLTTVGSSAPPGIYPISRGSLTAPNYNLAFIDGLLTVIGQNEAISQQFKEYDVFSYRGPQALTARPAMTDAFSYPNGLPNDINRLEIRVDFSSRQGLKGMQSGEHASGFEIMNCDEMVGHEACASD